MLVFTALAHAGCTIHTDAGDALWQFPDAVTRSRTPPEHSWYATDPAYRAGDPNGYLDPDMLRARLEAAHTAHPDITRIVEIGRSWLDQPILALRITDNPDHDEAEPAVLINGAHHGEELLTVLYALDVVDGLLADDAEAKRLVGTFDTWVVPIVNPDGVWTAMYIDHRHDGLGGRKNGRDFLSPCGASYRPRIGVDLNRNYPFRWGEDGSSGTAGAWNYRGPAAATEPEVQAMMRLAEAHRFVAAITFHTWGSVVLSPYTIDGVPNPDPNVAWAVASELVDTSPQKFRVLRNMYSVSGTDQDWLFHQHGTLAYIVEGSHHNPRDLAVRDASVAGIAPMWRQLYRRLQDGPRIAGHTVDEEGRPVVAQVRIDGFATHADERWTSRPRDGRFDQVLPEPGTYTVRATAEGRQTALRQVVVSPGRPVPFEVLVMPPARQSAH